VRLILGVIVSLVLNHPVASFAKADTDPDNILRKADLMRFPTGSYQVTVTVTTTRNEIGPDIRVYRVLSKQNDKSIVMTLEPAIDKGQILLMREDSLWAFLPNVSQPVRLPLSQKLTGQVANGDLARAKFYGDYEPGLIGIETIDGEKYYLLELIANSHGATYHRILYWVNSTNYRPYKAEFFSVSNRLLKTCQFSTFRLVEGTLRPTRLIMTDALKQGERSVLDYTDMVKRKLPDKVFTKDYLKKLF
jgi:outer membrane lipoprotein-sorting protein